MYNFLVDSHCHLNMLEDEKGLQMTDVVKKANENGVNIINNICTDVDEFDKILNASKKFKNVFTTVGVHPSNTENKISYSRQFYNDTVTRYNTKLEVFPSNIIASMFHFTAETLFEVDNQEARKNVKVDF